jgi:dihydropteroate synthase
MASFERPLIMGVLNTTPDSFSDGGKFAQLEAALDHAKLLVMAGAQIIDVGGESTRPGADRVSLEEEQRRTIPAIRAIREHLTHEGLSEVQISIDTMNAETAKLAVEAGATIVNDVSGGLADPRMLETVATTEAKYIIGHWRGFSNEMDTLNSYQDIAREVAEELRQRVAAAEAAGIPHSRIIVDPGLGFAKDMKQNWQLVARLDALDSLGLPILVGASRKRFIASAIEPEEPTRADNDRRDLATAVLTALLLQRKLWGVRVHNVIATADAIAIVQALRDGENS